MVTNLVQAICYNLSSITLAQTCVNKKHIKTQPLNPSNNVIMHSRFTIITNLTNY